MRTLLPLLVALAAAQIALLPEAVIEVYQRSEWTYYRVQLKELEMKHWSVSLEAFKSTGPIALTLRRGTSAVIGPEGVQTDAMDWPGWTYNQTKQVLFFPPFALSSDVEGVLGVYCPQLFAHYTLKLTASFDQTCPSQCSNHGKCRYTTCICDPGYSGIDCRLSTSLLGPGSLLSLQVGSGSWSLAEFPLPKQTYSGTATLTLTQINTAAALALWAKSGSGDELTFPTYYNNSDVQIAAGSVLSTTVAYGRDQMMYIAVYNPAAESVEIRLAVALATEYPSDSDQSLTISLSVALSGGFFCLLIGVIIYIIHRRRAKVRENTQRGGISLKTIESLFPIRTLSDLNSRNFSTQCDSCDEFFIADSSIRLLPCSHVFHSKCIDPWFSRHSVLFT